MHKVSIRRKTGIRSAITHLPRYALPQALYTTNPPTIDTIAAASNVKAAVDGVETVAGAALPIGLVAYTLLKLNVELL